MTIDEAFDLLIKWVVPSETETTKAASHRASIELCLKSNFGMNNFFRTGSFGHGTSLRGYSDVDYFAVIPREKLKNDSSATLRELCQALAKRFPNTSVYVDSPAVSVAFGTEKWERHEITPVDFLYQNQTLGYRVYDMPNRLGGWMRSSPEGLKSYTNTQNDRLSKKAKQVIRLVKLWNRYSDAKIRSVYIDMRVSEYLSSETHVLYPHDVLRSLRYIQETGLSPMSDPLKLGDDIAPCSEALKLSALSKINTAISRAEKAIEADREGRISEAFEWWDKFYFGNFPGRY
ncbi:nucleotidyltransferase [Azospirillum sp. HJ39]|uniref:SMODS domain-containing nucleotidyltransferase n=1 Tax=Azospirillum sp. HJ39 TaxID=3159496 RepID=UPI0035565E92